MDGLNRRAVERGFKVYPGRSRTRGRSWATVEGSATSAQRNFVDSAHGSALAGFAQALWSLSNRASSFSALGQRRDHKESARGAGRGPAKARQDRFGRNVFGWQLCSGQKGGSKVGKTKRGKGTKIMALADASGLPVALYTEAASPAEVTLAPAAIAARHVQAAPFYVVADKAYDSDPLRERLANEDMILLSPHRRGRSRAPYNDLRRMRRYAKRWKIERLFAWLHNFRRLVVRWEYHAANYHGFLELAAAIILLRHL